MKNRENLTGTQAAKLVEVRRTGSRLFRAWELKEDPRAVFQASGADEAQDLPADWPYRTAYCRIAQVVEMEKKMRRRRDDIIAAVELEISNARIEAINDKIKVTVRIGYGFKTPTTSWVFPCSGAQTSSRSFQEGSRKKRRLRHDTPTHTNYRRLIIFQYSVTNR